MSPSTVFADTKTRYFPSLMRFYRIPHLSCLLFMAFLPAMAVADIMVTDDLGKEVRLQQPARKIISLAPNLTELLFSAGAGAHVIATVRFSDYPAASKEITRIGDAHNLDLEAITALTPDLIVSWKTGTAAAIPAKLNALGFTVYQSEADTLEKIAMTIERFGVLAGTEDVARRRSRQFIEEITALQKQYMHREKVRVFYQFWDQPMYTVNGEHLISRFLEICGGINIYASLQMLTPRVSLESVLIANPQVIIASGSDAAPPAWLDDWRKWPELDATADGHLYFVPPDLVQRHTARVNRGIRMICEFIDRARQR